MTNSKRILESVTTGRSSMHTRDVSSKTVFQNPVLCAQFLRDNVDVPILKNVQPEDIEDVSERYRPYLGVEFESDTVKKIRIYDGETGGEEEPLFLISLIEHKSLVDYDVAMQLLRYMMCIWLEYRREMESIKKGVSRAKSFRYPMIIPVVYYEGRAGWTADVHLKSRIFRGEMFEKWIPDFRYEIIRVHDYSNEELLARGDEMSLIMLINKIQDAADLEEFKRLSPQELNRILKETPGSVMDVVESVIESLCVKMGVSAEETRQCVRKVKEREMGYLFENMENINIQEERRKTEEVREELRKVQSEVEKAQSEVEKAHSEVEKGIRALIEICQETGMTKETACSRILDKFGDHVQGDGELSARAKIQEKVNQYWK